MIIFKLTAYSTLILSIVISLFTDFCNNARTHLIYWNPLNIIFRVKPAAVLHVEQRDRVIFVCPKDEYFILWTYNKQAFENCSNPEEGGNSVNILYRCSFKDPFNVPAPKVTDLSKLNLWTPMIPQNALNRSLPAVSTATSISMPFRSSRWQAQKSLPKQMRDITKRSIGCEEGEIFILLINEFAWSTGTPSFQRNRPVYFTAQPKICLEENMRLTIVQGEIPHPKEEFISGRGLVQKELGAVLQTLQDCSTHGKGRRGAVGVYASGSVRFSSQLIIITPIMLLILSSW